RAAPGRSAVPAACRSPDPPAPARRCRLWCQRAWGGSITHFMACHTHRPPYEGSKMKAERVVELDLGCTPEAAVSGAILVQTEQSVFLSFSAMRPTDRMSPRGSPYTEDAGVALVEFKTCAVTKFGYPN